MRHIYLCQWVTVGPIPFLVLAKKSRFPLVPHQHLVTKILDKTWWYQILIALFQRKYYSVNATESSSRRTNNFAKYHVSNPPCVPRCPFLLRLIIMMKLMIVMLTTLLLTFTISTWLSSKGFSDDAKGSNRKGRMIFISALEKSAMIKLGEIISMQR